MACWRAIDMTSLYDQYTAALRAEKEQDGNVGSPIKGNIQHTLNGERYFLEGKPEQMGRYRGPAPIEYIEKTYGLPCTGMKQLGRGYEFYEKLKDLYTPVWDVLLPLEGREKANEVGTKLNDIFLEAYRGTPDFFSRWPEYRDYLLENLPDQFHDVIQALDNRVPEDA